MTEKKPHIDWALAARILSGEADEIDHGLLKKWLNENPANKEEWKKIQESWELGQEALLKEEIDSSTAWNKVRNFTTDGTEPNITHPGTFSNKWISIAAIFLLVLGILWWLLPNNKQASSSLIVSNNPHEKMVLNDGSTVTLNRGSKIACVQPFDSDQRVVELDGEGYFQVQGNSEWPFIVHAGGITIKVTGTRFNVRAYPNLNVTEVAVLEGKVEISASSKQPQALLNKGETALFDKLTGELKIVSSTDPNILAWLTGKINFNETPLNEVAKTLERVYGVTIQISDPTLLDQKLTARFSNNSLDFVLDVVCITFNLKQSQEGNTIFLSKNAFNE